MSRELTDEIISRYYDEKFPMDYFMSFIGLSNFQNREFGFVVGENRFVRNISFSNTVELKDFMVQNSVKHAYVGAVYDKPPSKNNPIQKIKWQSREFIYDIDIDEDVYCKDCWSLVQEAAFFIDETMKEDFGFKEVIWFFSGRRGVHGWVMDKITKDFDQSQRVAILNYLTFIHDEKRTQSIEEIPNEAKPLRNRIYALVAKAFLDRATPDNLKELGMSARKANEIVSRIKTIENFDHNQYNILIPNDTVIRNKLSEEFILRRYPRIDRKVTMDTRRVSRMPYSIHGKTGQIAIEIKNIEKFYPDSAPTVWDTMI